MVRPPTAIFEPSRVVNSSVHAEDVFGDLVADRRVSADDVGQLRVLQLLSR